MARIKLNKITAGSKLNMIQSDTFAGIINQPSHKNTENLDIYNFESNNEKFNNFFIMNDFFLQSNVNLAPPSQEPNYLNELLPDGSNNFQGIAQINDFVLGLTPMTNQGMRAEFTDSNIMDIPNSTIGAYANPGINGISGYTEYAALSADGEKNLSKLEFVAREKDRHKTLSGYIFNDRQFKDNREYQEMPVHVCVYPGSDEISGVYEISVDDVKGLTTTGDVVLNNIFYPKCALSGIGFNYLAEIPVTEAPSYDHYILSSDIFIEGNPRVFANGLNLKNMYDYKYDINTEVSASVSSYIDNNVNIDFANINRSIGEILSGCLKFARSYNKVNVSNFNTIWLSYKCDKYYENKNIVSKTTGRSIPDSNNITELNGVVYYEYEGMPISDKMSIIYPLNENDTFIDVYNSPIRSFEFIERIRGWNRINYQPNHKSNFYSILLKNTGLNDNLDSLTDKTIKTKLQNSINNIICKMIDKILPIHTQLLNIYWSGD